MRIKLLETWMSELNVIWDWTSLDWDRSKSWL